MEGISAEQLKKHLFKRFESQGVLDGLRATVRSQLALQLSSENVKEKSDSITIQDAETRNIPNLVSNWLLVDHLRRQSYDLTISTFMAEIASRAKFAKPDLGAGFDALQKHDIIDILGLGQKGIKIINGALFELINYLIDDKSVKKSNESSQTVAKSVNIRNSIDEVHVPSKRLEILYAEKLDQLREREKSLLDTVDEERKSINEISFRQRETLLNEIDKIQLREKESKLRLNERHDKLRAYEIKLEKQFEELKDKKKHFEDLSSNLERVVSSRCDKYKVELQDQLGNQIKKIQRDQFQVNERKIGLDLQEKIIDEIKQKHDSLVKRNLELEIRYEYAGKEIDKLQNEMASLKELTKHTWDYDQLKTSSCQLKQQISELKVQLSAATGESDRQTQLIKELTMKLSEPSSRVLALQKELNDLQKKKIDDENGLRDEISKLKIDAKLMESKLQQTEAIVENEVRNTKDLANRLNEARSALNESQNALRSQLTSSMAQPNINLIDHGSYFDTSLRANIPPELRLQSPVRKNYDNSLSKPSVDADFIRKAKLRLQTLELESKHYLSRLQPSTTNIQSSVVKSFSNPPKKSTSFKLPKSQDFNQLFTSPPACKKSPIKTPHSKAKRALFADNKADNDFVRIDHADAETIEDFGDVLHTSTPRQPEKATSQLAEVQSTEVEFADPILNIPKLNGAAAYPITAINDQSAASVLDDKADGISPLRNDNVVKSNLKSDSGACKIDADDLSVKSNTETLSSLNISAGDVNNQLPSANAKDDFSW